MAECKSPFFSIITVCYNAEKTIEKTITSILCQSFHDFEVIIVDGNSTDNTLNILKEFDDIRVKILSEEDNGIYYAMNKGLSLVTGKVTTFLNSDDVFIDENVLENVYEKFSFFGSKVVSFGVNFMDNNKKVREWDVASSMKGSVCWHPSHPGFFFETLQNQEIAFDVKYLIAADLKFMMNIIDYYGKSNLNICPDFAVNMAIGGISTGTISNRMKGNIEVFRIYIDLYGWAAFHIYICRVINKVKQKWRIF